MLKERTVVLFKSKKYEGTGVIITADSNDNTYLIESKEITDGHGKDLSSWWFEAREVEEVEMLKVGDRVLFNADTHEGAGVIIEIDGSYLIRSKDIVGGHGELRNEWFFTRSEIRQAPYFDDGDIVTLRDGSVCEAYVTREHPWSRGVAEVLWDKEADDYVRIESYDADLKHKEERLDVVKVLRQIYVREDRDITQEELEELVGFKFRIVE